MSGLQRSSPETEAYASLPNHLTQNTRNNSGYRGAKKTGAYSILLWWKRRLYQVDAAQAFHRFWTINPALFIGLCLLFGCSYAFHPHWIGIALQLLLCLSATKKKMAVIGLLFAASAFIYTTKQYPCIHLPQEKLPGTGIFHIEQIKPYSSFFNRSLLYKGLLKEFTDKEGNTYKNLPCQIYLPLQGKKNSAHTDYAITGMLCQKQAYSYVLKPDKKIAWQPQKSPFNWAQWRFEAKQSLLQHLRTQITHPQSATLLYALISGEVDERILSMEFGKIGLQHLLSVSGFHFALLALFIGTILHFIFPFRIALCLLITFLSGYYFFVGNSPAIERAYIAISLITIGKLLNWRISGLNALGMGLILELGLKPVSLLELGFQFSFLCTLAILLFYPPLDRLLQSLLLKRSYRQALQLSLFDQHVHLFGSMLRACLALNLAVHLLSIPVLIHLFHKFPLTSLLYNLLFSPCITVSMVLLFTALIMDFLLPGGGSWIHLLNTKWTSFVLTFTSNPPAALDYALRSNQLSLVAVIAFLSISFFIGVLFFEKENTIS